ncbi:MAG: restriction endonuclease subunit S [bacterium]|nr:restriction endonuclease subunit S [bacterium]
MIKINKSQRKTYKFGDIALSISERAEPKETKLDIYVGLEHIDPDCIHIKRKGHPSDVKGTKLRVYPGDIIFGKRRAYQRKAAIVDFDGICSAHAMVVRANPKVILPELMPFFIHSDVFMHRAVDVSEGSLSPTIKWKILAEQEFRMPHLGDQKRIADLLWSIDEATEKKKCLLSELKQLFRVVVEKTIVNVKCESIQLRDIASKTVNGFMDGDWIESKDQSEEGIRLLQLADIGVGVFLDKSRRFITEDTFKRLNCFEVLPGDILLARMPDPIGRACIVPDIGYKMITAVDCCIIRIDENLHNKLYWVHLLNSDSMKRKIESLASGTTRSRISRKNLEAIQVYCPTKKDQDKIVNGIIGLMGNIDAVTENIGLQYQIQKQIINQIFG